MRTLEVRPKNIMLKEHSYIQLEVYAVSEDGKEEKIPPKDVTFKVQEKPGNACGYIDDNGVLYVGDEGLYYFDVGVQYEDLDNIILTESYTVLREPNDKTIKDDLPIKRKTLSRITCNDLSEKAKKDRKKISAWAHTRAAYRILSDNKDFVWLFFFGCFAVATGFCIVLVINGISIDTISKLLISLVGFIISLLGKIYTPPGEVSEAITDRIQGTTQDEKIKKLQAKIQKLTQKKNQNRYFRGYTVDENSME